LFLKLVPIIVNTPDFLEWFKTRGWKLSKKRRYEREFDGLCTTSSTRNTFLKKELGMGKMLASGDIKPASESPARLICSSPGSIQMCYGPYTESLKKHLVKHTKDMQVSFAIGCDRQGYGRMLEERISRLVAKAFFLSADYGKFDSTVREEHFKIEHAIYSGLLPYDKDLIKQLADRTSKSFTVTHFTEAESFVAKVGTSRASGDPATTLGNTLINEIYWINLLSGDGYEDGLGEVAYGDAQVMVCGDDDLVIATQKGMDVIKVRLKRANEFGFVIKTSDVTDDPAKTEFLSGFFARARVGSGPGATIQYVHAAKLMRSLCKTGLTAKNCKDPIIRLTLQYQKIMGLRQNLWYHPAARERLACILVMLKRYLKDICPKWTPKVESMPWIKMGADKITVTEQTLEDIQSRYGDDLDMVDQWLATFKLTKPYTMSINNTDKVIAFVQADVLDDEAFQSLKAVDL
jgi:hypothetical protein